MYSLSFFDIHTLTWVPLAKTASCGLKECVRLLVFVGSGVSRDKCSPAKWQSFSFSSQAEICNNLIRRPLCNIRVKITAISGTQLYLVVGIHWSRLQPRAKMMP